LTWCAKRGSSFAQGLAGRGHMTSGNIFAVRTLLGWYRDGGDVGTRMPMLSTYLGHVHPANTYWYPSAAPE